MENELTSILFYVFGALALLSALVVVGQRNPLYSGFALIVALCCLSAIYGLMGSPFIAVLQIIVYAGAIMVLFLFVLMLLNVKREEGQGAGIAAKSLALVLGALLVLEVAGVLLGIQFGPAARGFDASTQRMAHELFKLNYVYVFEATSILILGALVGAVLLAKKEL